MDLLTVIIPVYNAERTIKKTIDSILDQKYQEIEVIVVNDGSTDRTSEILEQYDKGKVKVITTENKGVSSARNTGVKYAKGKYVVFVDADDYVSHSIYDEMIDKLKKTKCQMGFFSIAMVKKNQTINENIVLEGGVLHRKEISTLISLFLSGVMVAGVIRFVFLRDFIRDMQFDEQLKYQEDFVFCVKALSKVEKIYYMDQVGYYYNIHYGSSVEKYQFDFIDKILYVDNELYRIISKSFTVDMSVYYLKRFRSYSAALSNIFRYDAPKRGMESALKEISGIIDIFRSDPYKVMMKESVIKFSKKYYILFEIMNLDIKVFLCIIYFIKEKYRQFLLK